MINIPDREAIEKKLAEMVADLRKPQFQAHHPLSGACYITSEAFFHLGARKAGYKPKVGSYRGITHWWLENDKGEKFDLTGSQFKDPQVLEKYYEKGKGCGFLTDFPSKRARILMDRIEATIKK